MPWVHCICTCFVLMVCSGCFWRFLLGKQTNEVAKAKWKLFNTLKSCIFTNYVSTFIVKMLWRRGFIACLIEANLLENLLRQISWEREWSLKVVKAKCGLLTQGDSGRTDQCQPSVVDEWENKNYSFRNFFSQ